MSRFIELNMVVGPAVAQDGIAEDPHRTFGEGQDEAFGEDDGHQPEPPEVTSVVMVNIDEVREFYPRKHGKPGTRLVFKNGAGRPVTDAYGTVKAMVEGQ